MVKYMKDPNAPLGLMLASLMAGLGLSAAPPISQRKSTTGSAATSVSLSVTPKSPVFGSPVTLAATVIPAAAQGSVTFYDGATVLGTANLTSGTASLVVRLTTTGAQRIFAHYHGTAAWAAGTSKAVSVTVTSVPAFSFSVTTISGAWNGHESAVGDFNGDGIPDIVTASYGNIFVFPGDGAGNFGSPIQTVPASSQPDMLHIVTGDFNGDGKLDLAMVNGSVQQPEGVSVWLGRGDGTFTPGPVFSIAATSLAVADFNGDGFADLAVGYGPAPGINVYLSNGDGTFAAPIVYSVSGEQLGMALATADLNLDGNADLIAVTAVFSEPGVHNRLSVLMGRGDGTFLQSAGWVDDPVSDGNAQGSLAIGDLNGDGIPDLVLQDGFAYASYRCSVTALVGNGDGTFEPPASYLCGSTSQTSANGSSSGVLVADVDGDGKADVAALYAYNQGFLQLLPGNGDGTLQTASVFSFPNTLYTPDGYVAPMAMADFNGDGRIDFVASSTEGINVFMGGTGPLLRIAQTHPAVLTAGSSQAYTITVSNDPGAAETSGPVSVTDALALPYPYYSGITSMSGEGWNCGESNWTCTRSDLLSGGSSYPPITLQVQVSGAAPFLTNSAGVSGGSSPPADSGDTTPINPAISLITSVTTVGVPATSLNGISPNDWIEINGVNLVPATTPAAGVIWSDAPEFASGQMPTQLDGVSVTINGSPAYVEFYCSAATSAVCATDQINVLSPLDSTPEVVDVVVSSTAGTSPAFSAIRNTVSPSLLRFGGSRYVTATHADYSLLGPASLYPGYSTPAKPGEVVLLWAVGFGLPTGTLTPGSSTQSGGLPDALACTVGGNPADVSIALVSPGLYQMNLTVPAVAISGDNPVACAYAGAATPDGTLLAVN